MRPLAVQWRCQTFCRERQTENGGNRFVWGTTSANSRLVSLKLSALGHRVQRVGIPHCGDTCSRPLLSVTYGLNTFGSRVAYSTGVVWEHSRF